MSLAIAGKCPACDTQLAYARDGQIYYRTIGVEYGYDHPARYDGVSEWRCPDCGYREGRWTGRTLGDGEYEPRYGGAR